MRKFGIFFLVLLICFSVVIYPGAEAAKAPELVSSQAILAQKGTGRIFYEKNADQKAYPASTTKVMTALLAIENLAPDAVLSASETAIQIDRDGSNIGILHDEKLTVEQLLYALLVASANDAANVLAEAVAGDIPKFVDMMNAKANELGMMGTHFVNTHGYHDDNHYTTARDMLTLCMYAMDNPLFAKIVGTAQYEIPPTEKYEEVRYLSNNNALINPMKGHKYVYQGAAGVKTGSTQKAGFCLTSFAARDGREFFCVTLGAPFESEENGSFTDTIALFNYAFDNFSLYNVSDINEIVATHDVHWAKGDDMAVLTAKTPFEVLLPKGYDKEKLSTELYVEEDIYAPVKKGDILGRAEYFYDGQSLGSVDLVASQPVKRSFLRMVFASLFGLIFNAWVMTPLCIIVLLLLLRSMLEARRKRIARERRRQQMRRDFYGR